MPWNRKAKTIALAVIIVVALIIGGLILYYFLRPNPYCDPSLCGGKPTHIGCYGYIRWWSSDCDTPELIDITSTLKKLILKEHDSLRNDLASGTLKNKFGETLPMANRIGILEWNDDLAYLAELNTKQCKMKHDQCRNTKQFKSSGQNLAIMSAKKVEIPVFIKKMIGSWFNEYKDTRVSEIEKYSSPPASEKRVNGHFTAMAQDSQTHVGCGISSSVDKKYGKRLILACNYSNTNIGGKTVYKASTCGKPCCGCQKGCHPVYKFLCAEGEKIK